MCGLVSGKRLYFFVALVFLSGTVKAQEAKANQEVINHFLILVRSDNDQQVDRSLEFIRSHWNDGYESMLIETLYFSSGRKVSKNYLELLQNKTGENFGLDLDRWYHWLWNKTATYLPEYYDFKARLYGIIDHRFSAYFSQRQEQSTIRLDEVMWGGVVQDGIPPLRNPRMIPAGEAVYLSEKDVVFGV